MALANRRVGPMLMATIVCLSFVTICGRSMNGDEDRHVVSPDLEDEEAELERQLNTMNKTPVKTIWTDYGDIIDCIDIYKQPAFDHPLLKNHKIQRRPSNGFLGGTIWGKKTNSSISKNPNLTSKRCPQHTVPIRRMTREGLKRYRAFTQLSSFHPLSANSPGNHFALLDVKSLTGQMLYGASTDIDACNPKVDRDDQVSTAQIYVQGGPLDVVNSIQSGWIVHVGLYGDARTRFFTYWTGNKTRNGCFDVRCPGFVQVSRDYSLGEPLDNISIYGQTPFVMTVEISQDPITKHWWLYFTDKRIALGYWPINLFPYLSDGATTISLGGRTGSTVGKTSPQMGNGNFPDANYYHTCYFANINVTTKHQPGLVDLQRVSPPRPDLGRTRNVDIPSCYNLEQLPSDSKLGFDILFGGPGGDCGS